MKRNLFAFLLAGFFTMIILSCGNGSGEETVHEVGVTDTTITIGSFGPLTGPAALWGNIMKGMDAYFKMVNAEGGINGRKINFIMKDDGYDPSKTVPAVREMIQKDEVFAFVGGIGTSPCMAVRDYIVSENIPWVSPISGATHWSIPVQRNIFSVLPYYIDEGIIQAKYALDSIGTDKIGIIYQNDDVGKSALVGARSVLKAKGLDFVSEVSVEVTDTDLTSHVAKLKASGAEVVLLWTLPRQGVITVMTSNVVKFEPQFIASFILSDQTLMHTLTNGAWEGVIYGGFANPPFDFTNEMTVKYAAALKEYYPDVNWSVFPYGGFLYARVFTEALANMEGDVTREGLIDALTNLKDFDNLGLKMSYSEENHQATRAMQLLKCTGLTEFEEVSGYIQSDTDLGKLIDELGEM